ncbi:hypothetical protein LTR04_006849 [Oleoguttula sp. CCFEE 6159]|nr:hypothetical protein LTR04_006849 [Oleoguttula sp. CCFEE 6159]
MAAPVALLQPIKLPAGPAPLTPDQQYWRSFKSQLLIPSQHSSPVTHISSPSVSANPLSVSTPETFAVTSGSRVQIISSRTRKVLKAITRFGVDDIAHSGEIRRDGRVLVAGGDSGTIQAFDINSRAILKTWKEHELPVWTTKWSPTELTTLMSCSDDRTVRLWDLPSESSTATFVGHEDYVRSGCFLPGQSSNILVSGGYDAQVKIWDPRTPQRAAMTFNHAAAIESVLPLLDGTTLLASADNQISVLDIVAAKPLQLLKNHQKTVTSLSLASNGTRVVSGGLDGHVKIFETASWNVVAGFKYPSPILSLSVIGSGASREDKHLAVGMQSGLLSLRTRLSGQQKALEREKQKEMQALIEGNIDEYDKKKGKRKTGGWEKRTRGKDFTGEGADIVIDGNARGKIKNQSKWETALRKGQYATAIDLVLGAEVSTPRLAQSPQSRSDQYSAGLTQVQHVSNQNVLTLLTALRHRSALRTALKDRDATTLPPVLKWLNKNIADPRHLKLTSDVMLLLLDLYSDQMGLDPEVDKWIERLHHRVRINAEFSQQALSTSGMLDTLIAGA